MSDYAPEVGPDGRQRPRFGEYASPEEQRARIQQPDVTEALSAGVVPEASDPEPIAAAPGPEPRRSVSPANRLATILLLAVGAANVLISLFSYLDLASALENSYELLGIDGAFTNLAAARQWGLIAAIVLVAGYIATFMLSWKRLKAGRVSWWIPIVGGVVTFFIVSLCLMVPLMGDPAFQEYVTSVR
ncbi:DUF6264 family protein [Microbacterium sp. NPDC055910]|uniref:DUF6264 family protein n=1 Tax=Microbacterium sp. NPDC055910 TaxID=3345659 RepID=UPI0035E176FB